MTGALEKFIEQLTDPIDYVAAGVGALAGLASSSLVLFADAGTVTAAGAAAGVTLRRSASVALRGRRLRKRTEKLLDLLKVGRFRCHSAYLELLQFQLELFKSGVIDHQTLEETIREVLKNTKFVPSIASHSGVT